MTQKRHLSAVSLLSAPRIGAAVPNHDGTLAFYKVTTHSSDAGKTLEELRVFDMKTGKSKQLLAHEKDVHAVWVPGSKNEILYLTSEIKNGVVCEEKGTTKVLIAYADDLDKMGYCVATINAPVSNIKVKRLSDNSLALAVVGLMNEDGTIHNEEAIEKKTSGRIFDSKDVLFWNTFYKERRYAIFYGNLLNEHGFWKSSGQLYAFIASMPIEAPSGMYGPSDGANNFDICGTGIAFIARNLEANLHESSHTTTPFFMPIEDFGAGPAGRPIQIPLPQHFGTGNSTNIRVSPDCKSVAFLQEQHCDPGNRKLLIAALKKENTIETAKIVDEAQEVGFDPASSFEFTNSPDLIIIRRLQHGQIALARTKLSSGEKPQVFFRGGVKEFYPVKEGDYTSLIVSSSSFVETIRWEIIDSANGEILANFSSITDIVPDFGLSNNMVRQFWYNGDRETLVHCYMIVPPDFDDKSSYPWVLMPHGGPESSWKDCWSTRWNLALFAVAGLVVVAPQIAGSTGYGIEFTRRVHNSRAGAPFRDLICLIEHLETLSYIDQSRAVVCGASYGAYMVGWMLGDDIIKKFKGAVWHSGRFSLPASLLHADSPRSDTAFGGPPYFWENEENIERYNPGSVSRVRKYVNAPPTLVIHAQKDYRCQWTDGLALYVALQRHGIRSRFMTFPDEGHWITKPENAELWLTTILAWVNGCIAGDITNL